MLRLIKASFGFIRGAIRVPFYGIYEVERASVEVYHLVDGRYRLLAANERAPRSGSVPDRYEITPLGVELGLWQGRYKNVELPWLRWWDSEGNLLLSGGELARAERQRAETERQRAETERQRAELAEDENARLRERLQALGIDPETL